MNSSLILGQPIIIKSISNYSNVVSIPIQKINNDEYIVKVLNINYNGCIIPSFLIVLSYKNVLGIFG